MWQLDCEGLPFVPFDTGTAGNGSSAFVASPPSVKGGYSPYSASFLKSVLITLRIIYKDPSTWGVATFSVQAPGMAWSGHGMDDTRKCI